MRRLFACGLMILSVLFGALTVRAQDTVSLELLRDDEQLVIYLPNDQPVNLDSLALQVNTEGGAYTYTLHGDEAFASVDFTYVEAPACFVLRLGGTDAPLPTECANTPDERVFVHDVFAGDVFWFDPVANQALTVIVLDGVNPITLCPAGGAACPIDFPYVEPARGGAADVESREVLVLIADFDKIGGSELEPHKSWERTLNQAIAQLGDTINARVQRVPRVITSDDEARTLSDQYGATMIIWGLVDSDVLIESHYTVTPRWSFIDTQPGETQVIATLDEFEIKQFVVTGGDSEYILNFVLAQLLFFGDVEASALPILDKAIDLAPAGRELEMGTAVLYSYRGYLYDMVLGEHERAIDEFDHAIVIDPKIAITYYNRGTTYHYLGEYKRAIEDYDRAIMLDPEYANAYYNRGTTYVREGEYERAIEDFDHAIMLNPEDALAYTNRGFAYNHLSEYERAIEDFNRAIALNPELALTYFNLGNAYDAIGEYEQAIESYNRAIAVDPEYAYAYTNRGNIYAFQGEYEQAIEDYNRAIALYPENPGAYSGRGNVYADLGEYDLAIGDYDRAITLDPTFALAYINRGLTDLNVGDYRQAIDDLDRAIELDPNSGDAYGMRGFAFDSLGHYQEALADYRRYLELMGENADPFFIERVRELEAQLGNSES